MITCQTKDAILEFLLSQETDRPFSFSAKEMADEYAITPELLRMYLSQLKEMGLICYNQVGGGNLQVALTMSAYDFYRMGGFVAQEELLAKNLEKLLLEIESLKPSLPDRVEVITSIIANIATAIPLITIH
jgi:hypothetical protein